MNFKIWLENEIDFKALRDKYKDFLDDDDEVSARNDKVSRLLPNPVTVHGKQVNSTGEMNKVLNSKPRILARSSGQNARAWNLTAMNSQKLNTFLLKMFPHKEQRVHFINLITRDPIAKRIAEPVLNDQMTYQDFENVVMQLKQLGNKFDQKPDSGVDLEIGTRPG